MSLIKYVCLIAFTILSFFVKAQEYDGELQFVGKNFLNNKPLNNTKIKVMSNNMVVTEFSTKDNNNFKTKLDFGKVYDIYLINPNCQTMYIKVFADGVPENKRHYRMTYALDIPFFLKDPERLDTVQFSKQFHQIVFDGKSKFVDDTVYMNKFIKNIYKKESIVKKDTTVPFINTEKLREYVQLAGKLSLDNDKQTPLKNKTVSLVNKKGEVVSTSQTTNHGVFVFKKVDTEDVGQLSVYVASADNPNKDKIKLLNYDSEKVQVSSTTDNLTYTFKNSNETNLVKQLSNNDFDFNIAGKIIATNGDIKKVMSNKTVYLLGNKSNVIQKTKTNVLGTFLFSNIKPDETYSIAYDSLDAELNFVMNLYSVKDKFIKRLDSVSGKKFIYKFLSVTGNGFNDMVMDDSELKMNIKLKLFGENKNNPISDMKVLLLNDKYQTIDSAMTDKNGDFSFRHLPYTKQVLLTVDNEKDILEAFNNILVFDNEDNLIKIVSGVKGKKFEYRPLETDMQRFTEIYVDDPWLAIIEQENAAKKKAGSSETIIENILFEFNKSELQEQSKQTLDKVVLAMSANEKFNIELSAHSDSKGGDAYNLKLSEQRANSAKNYIISKGIASNRISSKGYGESKLLNNCGNNVICSDDEHAVNRRLEFKLIFK
jgi:outer membrane protein OmpA-like peptidoglycan-associated protein